MNTNSILSKYIHYDVNPSGDENCKEDVEITPQYETYTVDTIGSSILKRGMEQPSKEIPKPKERITNSNIIKNISFDQSEILWNIMQLYNGGEPFECDMTASELKFYGKGRGEYEIPVPKILFDVYPQGENIQKIKQFEKLPLGDNSISSIVCDLPFVISPKKCPSLVNNVAGSNMVAKRFSSFYPAEELFENIYWWINECFRVLKDDGILVWKMQSTVSGGRQVWACPFSFLVATKCGFYPIDEFILEAKARLISDSKIKKQMHARKYTSNFYVFKKDKKKATKNSILNFLEMCENSVFEGKEWEVK